MQICTCEHPIQACGCFLLKSSQQNEFQPHCCNAGNCCERSSQCSSNLAVKSIAEVASTAEHHSQQSTLPLCSTCPQTSLDIKKLDACGFWPKGPPSCQVQPRPAQMRCAANGAESRKGPCRVLFAETRERNAKKKCAFRVLLAFSSQQTPTPNSNPSRSNRTLVAEISASIRIRLAPTSPTCPGPDRTECCRCGHGRLIVRPPLSRTAGIVAGQVDSAVRLERTSGFSLWWTGTSREQDDKEN